MGLSNEERISKFFWTAQGWRKNLAELARKVGDSRVSWYTHERCDEVVNRWVAEVDTLVGLVHLKTSNGGSMFWMLGEGDRSLRGVRSESYQLRSDAQPQTYVTMEEPEVETVRWWQDHADHAKTAERLTGYGYKNHEGLAAIAHWWDCYGYMSSLSYALNRYDDKLFADAVHERFTRLCGEIINRRFEICFGAIENENVFKTEQYLLSKHNAFHSMLEDATKKLRGTDYFKKKFDGNALYERIAKMSAKDLFEFFEAKQKAKWDWDRKYHADEAKKADANPKPDGLFGPPVIVPAPEAPVPPKAKRKTK